MTLSPFIKSTLLLLLSLTVFRCGNDKSTRDLDVEEQASPPPEIIQQTVIDVKNAEPLEVAQALNNAMANTVEKVLPSVVVIRTERIVDWYGRRLSEAQRPVGQGSGVIIDPRGYIITNYHVLQGAQRVEVVMQDETSYPAQLVGRSSQLDIAVLKIINGEEEDFSAIEPGDSDAIRVGEMVMAIGSPFSLSSTVTHGLISQKGRSEANLPIVDFIQTSAPINPGNSGGPLIDMEGKLIGINSMIRTGSPTQQGSVGIGFAVPSNQALRAANFIIEGTTPDELPWLGVMMQNTRFGILFSRIIPESPAAEAGLMAGDLLLSVDQRPIRSALELSSLIRLSEPGDQLQLELLRGKEKIVREVTTQIMPQSDIQLEAISE